jgi:hypothetical protein
VNKPLVFAATLLSCIVSTPVTAATIVDPSNDFLLSYTGNHDLDLDVLSFSVNYNPTTSEFLLGVVLAGAINPAKAGLYIIGVDTGAGAIAPFGSIGAPNVKFDQVIRVNKNGTGLVSGAAGGPLSAAAITIVGNIFTARVPRSLLPSTGFAPLQYAFNIWPRNGVGGGNVQISDFAPDNGILSITGIPEPAAWGMLLTGFGLVGGAMRRRRTSVTFA